MKACAIVAVSAALFTAKVHAFNFGTIEYFADSACTSANKKKVEYRGQSCYGPSREGPHDGTQYDGVYVMYTCNATTMIKNFYSDSACTVVHPNLAAGDAETLECTETWGTGSNSYRQITCSALSVPTAELFVTRFYDGSADCSSAATGTHGLPDALCYMVTDYDFATQTWGTDKWSRSIVSGGRTVTTHHATSDCSDAGTERTQDSTTCGTCMRSPWHSDGDNMYVQTTCPSETTGAPRGASPGPLLAAAAVTLMLAAAGAA